MVLLVEERMKFCGSRRGSSGVAAGEVEVLMIDGATVTVEEVQKAARGVVERRIRSDDDMIMDGILIYS